MKRRLNLFYFFPVFIFIAVLSFFAIRGKIRQNRFYNNKSNAKVIDSSSWQQRTIEYYLKDGLQINARAGHVEGKIDIKVGDSIVKQAHSWYFDVYRENQLGQFEFFRQYHRIKDF